MEPVPRSNDTKLQNITRLSAVSSAPPESSAYEVDLGKSQMPAAPSSVQKSQEGPVQAPEQDARKNGLVEAGRGIADFGSVIMMGGGAVSIGVTGLYIYLKSHVMESIWDAVHPSLAAQESQSVMMLVGGIFGLSLLAGGAVTCIGKGLQMAGHGVDWLRSRFQGNREFISSEER